MHDINTIDCDNIVVYHYDDMQRDTVKKITKPILKALLALLILGAITGIAYLILWKLGLTDMGYLQSKLGDSFWLYFSLSILQAFQVVFIPLSNQIITVPASLAFPDKLLYVFLASWIGVEIGTICLYFIGRYGGKRLIAWVLGDREKADMCSAWLLKTNWAYPVGMLIPFLPDDILTTLAGIARFNFWYVLLVSTVARGICVASSVWGFGYLTRFWWGWIVIAVAVLLLVVVTAVMFKLGRKK